MPDPIPDPIAGESQIKNLAAKPPGILPKNAQALVIAGISVVMVAVIALSGGPSSKSESSTGQPKQQQVIDPNAARITEYRNRIEEQTRRLAAEQAQLGQAKQAFGVETGSLPAPPSSQVYASPTPIQPAVDGNAQLKDQQEAAEQKREYDALFASNVAFSLRKDAIMPPAATASILAVPPSGATAPSTPPPPVSAQPLVAAEVSPDAEPALKTETKRVHKSPSELQEAEGKQRRLFEGTIIETVLTNRLTGSLSGPVNCMVTTDVYSHDRQHLLIPKGSRVLGEVAQVSTFGQQRLAVTFHRIVMPDGFSVDLDQFHGLNQIGETGLRDQVNHHYMQTFGISLAIGAIAGLSQANTRSGIDSSGTDAYRQGVATSLSQSSLRILDRYLNVLPTFTVREGHRIKIYLSDDLLLPAYAGHRLPADL